MKSGVNVLIGLPTTSQSMRSATAIAIANTCKHLVQLGHDVDLHNIDSAEIVTARDMLANMLLHSSHWSHLLFIDSDMHFEPTVIERLIARGADLCAVAYVRRTLNLSRFLEVGRATDQIGHALAQASSFTFKPYWAEGQGHAIVVQNGFCSAAAVGMGCALISKRALELMVEKGDLRPRNDLHAENGQVCWSFFENLEVDSVRLGEDYSFCYRWTEILKQELHVCIDTAIGHLGGFEYSARYIDVLFPTGES